MVVVMATQEAETEPMVTLIHDAMWRYHATKSYEMC